MYVREHNAAKDNQNQIKEIYESVHEKYSEIFKIKSIFFANNDNYRSVSYGLTLSMFFVFNLLPLILLLLFNNYPLCYLIMNICALFFAVILFIISVFVINNDNLWKDKSSKYKYAILISTISINYFISLILITLSFVYIKI